MTGEEGSDETQASLRIADAFIELANAKLDAGIRPLLIAPAMRHAAANFTAFAQANETDVSLDTDDILAEFRQWLESYDSHHRDRARHMTPLERLVEQVDKE